MHMLSRKDLNSAELETVRVSKSQTTVVTANGQVKTNYEATVYVKELDLLVTVKLLEDTPPFLSLGQLCEDQGRSYEWTSGQPQLIKDGRRIQCSTENYVPIVAGLSTGSSSSTTHTSPASLPQDPVVSNIRSATGRSESTSSRARRDLSPEPTETEKKIKMRTPSQHGETCRRNQQKPKKQIKMRRTEPARRDLLRDLPEWFEEFTDNLVDERVPVHSDAPASTSRESASEPLRKVVSGKNSIYTHFPRTEIATLA